MKRTRKLAASMVVTVGVISGCHPAGPDHPEPTRNPPMPTVTTSPTTETPDLPPVDPDVEPVNELPDAPTGKGELIREGELCFWLPAVADATDFCPDDVTACNPPPPPMRVPVSCPTDFANLPDAPPGEHVDTRDDGTCFYMKSHSMDCPEGAYCNPPPPRQVTVRCRSNAE